ncbi:MAG: pseudouridine synthase [Pseudomonadota bacterium]
MKRQRLDQLLSNLGYCSRGQVRDWLRQGRVEVQGVSARNPADKVLPDTVRVDGEPLDHPDGLSVIFHKPVGYVCSHKELGRTIYELLPARWAVRKPPLSSVGRLDKDTSGLLLLTDDGQLLHRLTSPRQHIPKVYEAILAEPLRGDETARFAAGTLLLEGEERPCLPAELEVLGPQHVRLTLHEGRYHQVRRMFAAVGNHVTALHRAAIGRLRLGGLAPGAYRELTPADLQLALHREDKA